ncbi:hypothetical protein SEENIN0B_03989 [Salmonella enterica subsp. enterica serovar Infantis str. SARB27]|uniref:Uncharacterized protein n=1 Tax=Salmonella enterica subsp. enterica serovar Infantis str. SARB27 TaxID=596155 RepID=A0A6C8G4B4_SALIN|nr:hypothetical protein TY21A_19140 [Salmonella enterica subsp. enterica serovar Typhi str. Ty21a]EHB40289.1 hypothetical protein SEENIN0B_03989 [Salmonella enterica subsp. enterica serovar Infantis str. SARB27]ELX38074.1 hypothetical protein SEEJ1593_13109 [Salmonella enterica subsp. enterica serovar Javiana str. ATCC BAA-1593]ESG83575.1 hypothetical protein SEEJ0721_09696 [Salmonella enterica subsp. enterica serovar Javiana str. 10721]ESG89461.1 hypothetical protein SEEJ0720_05388 [Salmonella
MRHVIKTRRGQMPYSLQMKIHHKIRINRPVAGETLDETKQI